MAIHSVRDNGGEPNTWKVRLFANIGGGEDFVVHLIELPELVDASMIFGDARDKLKEAIIIVLLEGLMPAFEHLKRIRALSGQPVPELNRKLLFEDFSGALWKAYKDLMQQAAKMMEPDFGFLFQRETQFEAGLLKWGETRPKMAHAVGPYLRKQRTEWQNDLGKFRNYLEHKDDTDPNVYTHHYEPAHAEKLFETVWRTIADILAMLVSLHLPPGTRLIEINPEERDKVRPRRFRFDVAGIRSTKQESR